MKGFTKFINEKLSRTNAEDLLLKKCEDYANDNKWYGGDVFDHENDFQEVVLKQMFDDKLIDKNMYNKLLEDDDLWEDLLVSLTER